MDERTCLDLDLPSVFTLLDRTVTIPGAAMLYFMLRKPLFDRGLILSRRDIIDRFGEDPASVSAVQAALAEVLHPGHDDVTDLLLHGPPEEPPSKVMSFLGTSAAAVSLPAMVALQMSWGSLLPLAAFVMNMIIYYRHYGSITRRVEALGYIGAMAGTAEKLAGNEVLRDLDGATAEMPAGLYDNRHFADRLDEGGLDFDYLLKPGILATCNAIDLLERIGYPPEVVARARSAG